jgi:hypothetical protein
MNRIVRALAALALGLAIVADSSAVAWPAPGVGVSLNSGTSVTVGTDTSGTPQVGLSTDAGVGSTGNGGPPAVGGPTDTTTVPVTDPTTTPVTVPVTTPVTDPVTTPVTDPVSVPTPPPTVSVPAPPPPVDVPTIGLPADAANIPITPIGPITSAATLANNVLSGIDPSIPATLTAANTTIAISNANLPLGVRPLTIQTVPPVSGARFVIDGHVLVTGKDGAVRTTVTKAQRDGLALARDTHLSVGSPSIGVRKGVRAQFAGWYDGGYHFSKANPSGQLLLAAYDFYFLTSFRFVDGTGALVQSSPPHDLLMHATSGATVTLKDPSQPVWLRGLRVASSSRHLAVDDLSYSISSAVSKGNNIVRTDEQRFRPSRDTQVTIRSLFFTVQFRAHDVFMDHGTGSSLELQFADGSTQSFPLQNGQVTISQLPRGAYQLKVRAFGLKEHHAVSISRNQTVSLPVLNAVDFAIVGAVGLAIAAALLALARVRRHRHANAPSSGGLELNPSRSA